METAVPSHMAPHLGLVQDARKRSRVNNANNSMGVSDEKPHDQDKSQGMNTEIGGGESRGGAKSERFEKKLMTVLTKGTEAGSKIIPTEIGKGGMVAPQNRRARFLRRGTHAGVVESGEPKLRPTLLHLSPEAFMDPDSAAEVQG